MTIASAAALRKARKAPSSPLREGWRFELIVCGLTFFLLEIWTKSAQELPALSVLADAELLFTLNVIEVLWLVTNW